MDRETEELLWFWLCNIRGIGRTAISKLLEYFGSPLGIYEADGQQLDRCINPSQREAVVNSRNKKQIREQLNRVKNLGIAFLWRDHPLYPRRLGQLFDAPYGLYLRGRLPVQEQRTIAIVGARKADYYGMEMAFYFGRELAKLGIGVISGLAYGVDGQAHQGALAGEGYTLGILGSGINVCYPRENYKIYRRMGEEGGILSEYGLDVSPRAGLFPVRNRLIAAMADGILVTQAKAQSGSLITVDQGLELGRDIFAIPGRLGDELSEGCNQLIQSGARMVTGVEDILEEWGHRLHPSVDFKIHRENTLVKISKMVYSCMRLEPKYIDTIIEETHLSISELLPILMELERQGYVKQTRRNYYSVVL